MRQTKAMRREGWSASSRRVTTLVPEMAVKAGILEGTRIVARRLDAEHPSRSIALVWRKNSPREKEFRLLADALKAAA